MTDIFQADNHVCFGCQKQIRDHEPHIHFTLDEWASRDGHAPLGLDDLFKFTFCLDCTNKSSRGWTPEAHEIEAPDAA